jgi:hypothetical protein
MIHHSHLTHSHAVARCFFPQLAISRATWIRSPIHRPTCPLHSQLCTANGNTTPPGPGKLHFKLTKQAVEHLRDGGGYTRHEAEYVLSVLKCTPKAPHFCLVFKGGFKPHADRRTYPAGCKEGMYRLAGKAAYIYNMGGDRVVLLLLRPGDEVWFTNEHAKGLVVYSPSGAGHTIDADNTDGDGCGKNLLRTRHASVRPSSKMTTVSQLLSFPLYPHPPPPARASPN